MSRPHSLYRFYGDDGALLYVGISANPAARFARHSDDKAWWEEVRGIGMEPYPDRDSVLAAEARAIEVERPRYNLQRPTVSGRRRRGGPAASPLLYMWACEVCGDPIADRAGYVYLNSHERHQAEQAAVEFKRLTYEPITGGQMISGEAWSMMPDPAHWRVSHHKCDPDPDCSAYTIEIERIRNPAALLAWTAHLMGKRWLGTTDWRDLIERMAGVGA